MKRFREDIELEVSVKTDEPDQLAEYTKMVLGDNAKFFDCDFNDCEPCEDVDEFEDKSVEVFDDGDDDDMTDDEFIEAFGKAMKDKHDEVLTEGEFTDKVKGFVKNKITDPLKKKVGFDVKSGGAQYAVREFKLTKEKEKDQDGKETGKDIIKRTVVGSAFITPDYKAAEAKAKQLSKQDGGSNAGIRTSIAVAELKDVFKDVCDKYDFSITKNTPGSWIEVAVFKDGDVDPKFADKHTALESKVNSLISKEKEDKKFNKQYGSSYQEVNPETGEAINQETSAEEEPDVTEIPIEHTSTASTPETSAATSTPAESESGSAEPAKKSPTAATAARIRYNKVLKTLQDNGIDISKFVVTNAKGNKVVTDEFKKMANALVTESLEDEEE
ncbi:MAG: hypothetical protein J6W64_08010 [Bacilli bacterium]|nr:hypothetical protein [Bacilli bacterium]